MPNTINTITKYGAEELDGIFAAEAKSAVLEAAPDMLKFINAKTVMLPDIVMSGLGDYSRTTGFPTGSVTVTWTPYVLQMDRGQSFLVDAMDDEETAGVAFGKLSTEFLRTKVIPEIDAYRFSKLLANAKTDNITESVTPAKATIVSTLLADDEKFFDNEIDGNYVRFVSSKTMTAINQSTEVNKVISQVDINSPRGINFKVQALNEVPLIPVPKARFKTNYTFSATDGFAPATGAGDIHWLTVHKNAALPVAKHEAIRVFSPEVNQDADGWKFQYRIYHDIFTPKNKQDGISAGISITKAAYAALLGD